MAAPPKRPRMDPSSVERIGIRKQRDVYHFLMRSSWARLFLMFVALYLMTNTIFGLAYMVLPEAIENARPGNFGDAFFFSVQTMATIGYGKMAPVTLPAHLLVTIQAVLGTLEIAVATGITFAKFSQPTARVIFSNNMLVQQRDGVRSLIFRVANERSSNIVEARLRLTFLRTETTREGERIRRLIELKLQRDTSPLFALSWLAVHVLDESSPLFGATIKELEAADALFAISLVGIEETFSQTVHVRHSYSWEDVLFEHKFVDILTEALGRRTLDYSKFHDTLPIEQPKAQQQDGAATTTASGAARATS